MFKLTKKIKKSNFKCFSNFIDEKDKIFFHKIKDWWDPSGSMRTLHYYNDLRINYIKNIINNQYVNQISNNCKPFKNLEFIDIGCGGGLLVESLARLDGNVIGIDSCENSINIAKGHLDSYQGHEKEFMQGKITYHIGSVDDFISKHSEKQVDIVTAMEVIEHVNNPLDFLRDINKLIKYNGLLFMSTINKNYLSYVSTILIAEKLAGIIPDGTHDWNKYIEPEKLSKMLENTGFEVVSLEGVLYNPITNNMYLSQFKCINYMLCAKKLKHI